MIINDYYQELSRQEKKMFKKKVTELTGWSHPTFYNKLRLNNLTKLEIEAIEKIITAKKFVDDDEN